MTKGKPNSDVTGCIDEPNADSIRRRNATNILYDSQGIVLTCALSYAIPYSRFCRVLSGD